MVYNLQFFSLAVPVVGIVTLVVLIFFLTVPAGAEEWTGAQRRLAVRELKIIRANGLQTVVKAEVARTDEQRERGLMFRTNLREGDGMLFIFEKDQVLSLWMKNTYVPLSIAYIASDGVIIDIFDMKPKSIKSISSSRSARYALEVPQGFFKDTGVAAGDTVVGLK
jgi:uncharacterized membrane protein (UPF0127 family)